MKALVVAIALVFAIGVAVPPADAKDLSKGQSRQKERWGCIWRSLGVFTYVIAGSHYEGKFWEGMGTVLRCKPRPQPRAFDVWVEVRRVVRGQPNPLLARGHRVLIVMPGGKIRSHRMSRFTAQRQRWFSNPTTSDQVVGGNHVCDSPHTEADPPTAEPVRVRLIVKRRSKKRRLYVASRAWQGPVCSSPDSSWWS